jgi:hypothetical protein
VSQTKFNSDNGINPLGWEEYCLQCVIIASVTLIIEQQKKMMAKDILVSINKTSKLENLVINWRLFNQKYFSFQCNAFQQKNIKRSLNNEMISKQMLLLLV